MTCCTSPNNEACEDCMSWPFAGQCRRAVAGREGCCDRLQIGVGELLLKREGCRNHLLVGVGELRCRKRARAAAAVC
jgi:hypothetical protein